MIDQRCDADDRVREDMAGWLTGSGKLQAIRGEMETWKGDEADAQEAAA